MNSIKLLLFLCLLSSTFISFSQNRNANLDALEWRFIGPIVGNRGSVVLGQPPNPMSFISERVMVFGKPKMPVLIGNP